MKLLTLNINKRSHDFDMMWLLILQIRQSNNNFIIGKWLKARVYFLFKKEEKINKLYNTKDYKGYTHELCTKLWTPITREAYNNNTLFN